MAHSVPLSRSTFSGPGCLSFFVRPHKGIEIYCGGCFAGRDAGSSVFDEEVMDGLSEARLALIRARQPDAAA